MNGKVKLIKYFNKLKSIIVSVFYCLLNRCVIVGKIQIDMFEVQLGSAILLQFITGDKLIRVLADAGIHAKGYPINHVHQKLPDSFAAFGNDKKYIDLIIGTHYDKDHLDGLVPIIDDTNIKIKEAWLPPVMNDTEIIFIEEEIHDHQMLAVQLYDDPEEKILKRYLINKLSQCQDLKNLTHIAYAYKESDIETIESFNHRLLILNQERDNQRVTEEYFISQYEEASSILNEPFHDDIISDIFDYSFGYPFNLSYRDDANGFYDQIKRMPIEESVKKLHNRWKKNSKGLSSDINKISIIRKGVAKDAINAISLNKVVKSLKKRNIPIKCKIINDGEPLNISWNNEKKCFGTDKNENKNTTIISLLGPSKSLVKKHANKIPIGNYMMNFMACNLLVKPVTPSNQLSYVVKFQYENQGILIAGDAGFVDFKPLSSKSKNYYPSLLESLNKLHIIQIAHHAGRNSHFYHVIQNTNYSKQEDTSFLLLSHATKDRSRPSKEFESFVKNITQQNKNINLLFTCMPQKRKVNNYQSFIYKNIGVPQEKGDVRLIYDGTKWIVKKHSILVN